MSVNQGIVLSKIAGVGIILLDHSEKNCYDLDFMCQLNEAINSADNDPEIKVVLLKSASPRFFCVGHLLI